MEKKRALITQPVLTGEFNGLGITRLLDDADLSWPADVDSLVADPRRARAELGWKPPWISAASSA